MITSLPIIGLVYIGILFLFLMAGMWIGVSVGAVAIGSMGLLIKGTGLHLFVQLVYGQLHSFILTAVPLFIFIGEILLHTGVGNRLYTGLAVVLSRVPGGLIHVNIWSSAVLAAASGSSMATCATISAIAVPELEERGYQRSWALSSLAVAGTLGILIPPSVVFIIYGFLTQTPVIKLFTAGIIPGIILASMLSILVLVQALRNPASIGGTVLRPSFKEAIKEFTGITPVVILIVLILGSLYGGIATPTEAAGLGVLGALVVAAIYRKLTVRSFVDSVKETVIMMGAISFVIIGSLAMGFSIGNLVLGERLMGFVGTLPIPPMGIVFVIYLIYILLGCVMDGLSLIMITVPIVYPLAMGLGFDPIWFGVIVVVIIEMAAITPPIGVNLWAVQAISGEPMEKLARALIPFYVVVVVFLLLLTFFPQIATWLPSVIS